MESGRFVMETMRRQKMEGEDERNNRFSPGAYIRYYFSSARCFQTLSHELARYIISTYICMYRHI